MSRRPSENRLDGRGESAVSPEGQRARLEELEVENAQLHAALDSRVVIEQAKGILAERFRLEVHEAFLLLRRAARTNRRALHAVAVAVIESPATPSEVLLVMNGDGR